MLASTRKVLAKTLRVAVTASSVFLAEPALAEPLPAARGADTAASAARGHESQAGGTRNVSDGSCPESHPRLAVAASLVPGVLLHGTGHYVAGCREAGENLFWVSLTGLGLIATAFMPAMIWGAHPYLVPFQAFMGMTGLVMFGGSWLVDVYGTLLPRSLRGTPQALPWLQTQFGYRYVYDPVFSYRHFVEQGFDYWHGPWRFAPRATFSLGAHNTRYRLPISFRALGRTVASKTFDATFVDVTTALTRHDFGEEGFDVTTLELGLETRLDLERFRPEFNGMFVELGAGVGLNRFSYDAPLASHDSNSLLLMSFALGGYFGSFPRGGDAKLYYDHRHDDYAAGLKLPGLGSGIAGHFGLQSQAFWNEHWGILLDSQVGSAYVLSASLLFRQGALHEN